jgi:hypothetical protein
MWRAIFLGVGITLCILGAECIVVEKAVLANSATAPATPIPAMDPAYYTGAANGPQEIQSAEWMPWFFLTTGIVVIIYSVTIPRRLQGP